MELLRLYYSAIPPGLPRGHPHKGQGSPQLTTVDVNPYQLGMEAASQTINHIENPNLLATKIIVPHKLIPRESCCPPEEQR